MKTRITELFGIKYPILLSGMSWISVPKMVAAVFNAGGLGILATGPLSAEETRDAVHEIRSLTDKPFGANLGCLFPGAVDSAKVLLEEKVPSSTFPSARATGLSSRPTHTEARSLPPSSMPIMQRGRRTMAAMPSWPPATKRRLMEKP